MYKVTFSDAKHASSTLMSIINILQQEILKNVMQELKEDKIIKTKMSQCWQIGFGKDYHPFFIFIFFQIKIW